MENEVERSKIKDGKINFPTIWTRQSGVCRKVQNRDKPSSAINSTPSSGFCLSKSFWPNDMCLMTWDMFTFSNDASPRSWTADEQEPQRVMDGTRYYTCIIYTMREKNLDEEIFFIMYLNRSSRLNVRKTCTVQETYRGYDQLWSCGQERSGSSLLPASRKNSIFVRICRTVASFVVVKLYLHYLILLHSLSSMRNRHFFSD